MRLTSESRALLWMHSNPLRIPKSSPTAMTLTHDSGDYPDLRGAGLSARRSRKGRRRGKPRVERTRLLHLFLHADGRVHIKAVGKKDRDMRLILSTGLLIFVCGVRLAAQEAKPPRWDARGVGPLPRMGITSLDVSD